MHGITACRVCGSKKLEGLYSFGDFYMSDFVDSSKENTEKVPLELVLCKKCTLVQLRHTASQDKMYTNYWYRSGVNPKIVSDLKEIAEIGMKMGNMEDGDAFMDLGSNDGTLLSFVSNNFKRIAVEPAKNFQEELKKHCDVIFPLFWERVSTQKCKVITAIGMLYDAEDPNLFIKNVKNHLADDGIFIAQMMTLKTMIASNDVGNICHEHLEYYSYKSLRYLFQNNGLEITKIEENDINGGSYRIFARHIHAGSIRYLEPKINFKEFIAAIKRNKELTRNFILKEANKGKKIYVYGASTKGNTILQFYGLDKNVIIGAADRNSEKWGKFTVGTGIPIMSEEEARKDADYFWLLPYTFFEGMKEREKDWIDNGGKIILSTPHFQIFP